MTASNLLRHIAIGFFLSIMACGALTAQPVVQYPQEPLQQRVERISRDFKIYIAYDQLQLKGITTSPAMLPSKSVVPEAILKTSLEKTGLTYRKQDAGHYFITPLKKGILSGSITDVEDGTPLNGVSIEIGSHHFTASPEGLFLLTLGEGTYRILLSAVGYETKEIPAVGILAGRALSLNFTLRRKPLNLPEVKVVSSITEEAISAHYAKQKLRASVTDGVVTPQILAIPDNQLSGVVKRMNGVNLTGNTVGIRGFSERYSQVAIDGISLPSLSLNRRALALNLLPKELVREITLVKTATPDISSDFTGGQIQIHTLGIPNQHFTSFYVEGGGNSPSVFRSAEWLGAKGRLDWLGVDDGTRKKPNGIRSWQWYNNVSQPPPNDPTGKLRLIAGEPALYHSLNAKEQSKNISAAGLALQKGTMLPDFSLNFSLGRSYVLKEKHTLGFVWGSSVFKQQSVASFYNRRRLQVTARPDSLRASFQEAGTQYSVLSGSGTVFNLGFKSQTFQARINNLFSTQLKDEFSSANRSYPNKGQLRHFRELFQQPEQSLFQQHQLELHKRLARYTTLDYFLTFNKATQKLLDRRHLQYFQTSSGPAGTIYNTPNILYNWRQNNDSNMVDNRTWIDAKEKSYHSGLSVTQNIFHSAEFSGSLKSGWMGSIRSKTFSVMRLLPYSNASTGLTGSYHELLSPSAESEVYYWAENTNGNVFSGKVSNQAFYFLMDQSYRNRVRLYYGLRAEYYHMQNDQQIFLKRLYNGIIPPQFSNGTTGEETWSLLPSVQVLFSVNKKMNLRTAFSKTALRPDFRETSYFSLYDYELDANINGRQLVSTLADNFDFRWEWYPSPTEIISLSFFHKQLQNPVELAQSAPFPNAYGYVNQHRAQTSGMEIELRKSLKFIAPQSFLKKMIIQSAFTANWSKVEIMSYPLLANGAFTQRRMPAQDRPLFNQAPWTVNAAIVYETSKAGISVFYNRSGPKTFITHINPNLIEYENGVDQLDVGLYIQCLNNRGRITISALNLPNQWRIYYRNNTAYQQVNGSNWELVNGTARYNQEDGDIVTYRIRQGINGHVGFVWKF